MTLNQTYRPMELNGEPRNSPGIYGKLIFNKGAENAQWGEEINAVGKTGFPHAE